MNHGVRLAAGLALLACSRGLGRPLTPQERKVRIATASQDVSIRLSERCEPVGLSEMKNVTAAEVKAKAVQKGGNVAQILYETERSASITSDVRFWKCPE